MNQALFDQTKGALNNATSHKTKEEVIAQSKEVDNLKKLSEKFFSYDEQGKLITCEKKGFGRIPKVKLKNIIFNLKDAATFLAALWEFVLDELDD